MLDARAEAEKRYGRYIDPAEGSAFLAGAVWALREFGWMLEAEAHRSTSDAARSLALSAWWAEAHHIADGIEEEAS